MPDPVPVEGVDPAVYWESVRALHAESQAEHYPRHLVVDRFSYDPGEIGVTTDSDQGVW